MVQELLGPQGKKIPPFFFVADKKAGSVLHHKSLLATDIFNNDILRMTLHFDR